MRREFFVAGAVAFIGVIAILASCEKQVRREYDPTLGLPTERLHSTVYGRLSLQMRDCPEVIKGVKYHRSGADLMREAYGTTKIEEQIAYFDAAEEAFSTAIELFYEAIKLHPELHELVMLEIENTETYRVACVRERPLVKTTARLITSEEAYELTAEEKKRLRVLHKEIKRYEYLNK